MTRVMFIVHVGLALCTALRTAPPLPRAWAPRMCSEDHGFAAHFPELPPAVADRLAARGIRGPTPIQRAALPLVHAGESLLLHAETGSGKSLAFLLPALTRMGLAGLSAVPPELADRKVLVIAPTRELAVQLANEADLVLPAAGAVQIVAVGALPEPAALLSASVITCTAPELLALLRAEGGGDVAGVIDAVLSQVRVVVLDEVDMLLPVASSYGPRAAQRKKADARKNRVPITPAEELVRLVVDASSADDLQLLAASATMSRPTRLKLGRVLRRDPLGRWYDKPPQIVRPLEVASTDLSAVPRAVVIPRQIRHKYVRLSSSVRLKRATPATARRPTAPRRLSLKQKRAAKLAARKASKFEHDASSSHPLFTALSDTIAELQPASALIFLCRSSGLTVRRAARDLRALGLSSTPLHEAIGLEHAPDIQLTSSSSSSSSSSSASLRRSAGEVGAPQEGSVGTDALRAEWSGMESSGMESSGVASSGVASSGVASSGVASSGMDTSVALRQRHRAISDAFTSRRRRCMHMHSHTYMCTRMRMCACICPGACVQMRLRVTPHLHSASGGGANGTPGQAHSSPAEGTGGHVGVEAFEDVAIPAGSEESPLLITFEDMARGLHFDAVDAVFILGMPDSPATYLHLAGRTGRAGLDGTVVTLCPGRSHEQLVGWSRRLGDLEFEELAIGEEDEATRPAVVQSEGDEGGDGAGDGDGGTGEGAFMAVSANGLKGQAQSSPVQSMLEGGGGVGGVGHREDGEDAVGHREDAAVALEEDDDDLWEEEAWGEAK